MCQVHVQFFRKLPNCFPQRLYHFIVPLALCERPNFSASSPAFGGVTIFIQLSCMVCSDISQQFFVCLFVLLLLNRELLIVVLICVSLVAKYVEYLFMCYLYILFGEVSPSVFADFLNGLFSYCRIFRVLCVFQVLVLSLDMQFANIFSQSVACLFILFTGYFAKQKLLILMKSIAVSTFILTFCVQSKPAPGVSPLVPSSHLKPLETQTLSVSPQGGSAPQWSSSLTHSTVSFRKSDQIH